MRSPRRAGRSGNGACPLISSIAAPPCGCSRRTRSTRPGSAAMSDDFELLRDSFRRDLRLRNKADRTIGAYVESVDRFIAWARSHGLTSVTQVTRGHVRAWLEETPRASVMASGNARGLSATPRGSAFGKKRGVYAGACRRAASAPPDVLGAQPRPDGRAPRVAAEVHEHRAAQSEQGGLGRGRGGTWWPPFRQS